MMTSLPDAPTPSQCRRHGWRLLALQFAALIIVSVIAAWLDVDRKVSALFWSPEAGWRWADAVLCRLIYQYGTIPGLVLAIGGLVVWIGSYLSARLRPWRLTCMVVVLTTALSAGFIVNAVLKQYWGRPRPDQTVTFGGQWAYRGIFPPGIPGKGASFPCGHCTMGFVFFSLALCGHRSRPLARAGLGTALVMGSLLGVGRVVQGSHYVTDVIWSGGIVAMTATTLHYIALSVPAKRLERSGPKIPLVKKTLLIGAGLIAAGAMTAAFMTRRPFYETHLFRMPLPEVIKKVEVIINADPERFDVTYAPGKAMTIRVHAHGFGWAYFDYGIQMKDRTESEAQYTTITVVPRSYFAELDHALEVILPEWARDRVTVTLRPQPSPSPPKTPNEGPRS